MAADGAPRPNASCHPLNSKVQVRARPSRSIDRNRISLADEAPPVCTIAFRVSSGSANSQYPQPAQAPAARNVALDSLPPKCGPRYRLPSSFIKKKPPQPSESRRTVTPVPLQRPSIPCFRSVWRIISMGVFILRLMASLLVPSAVDTRECMAICWLRTYSTGETNAIPLTNPPQTPQNQTSHKVGVYVYDPPPPLLVL